MNKQIVMVPIHLDGLLVTQDSTVAEANKDFGKLPFMAEKDINPDTPNISEAVLSPPFQNQNLTLQKGMHLHWALPDALTRGQNESNGIVYPAVPNRWLVIRKKNNTIEKQWIVEGDYLHPEGVENTYGGITYPFDVSSGQPYRYMGRQVDYDTWSENPDNSFLNKLTAVGYGDPTFASFYPNCHSVFGAFDQDIITKDDLTGLRYQLIGWYSQQSLDVIYKLFQNETSIDKKSMEQLIKDTFQWNISLNTSVAPEGMCCYANLEFKPNGDISNIQKNSPTSISIGNTGTEALSTHIAAKLDGVDLLMEEQLEALLSSSILDQQQLDLGFRFKETRHKHGFTPENGGILWELKPKNDTQGKLPTQIMLPTQLGNQLNELNQIQQQVDQAKAEIEDIQHLLFSDWYKYMICAYPPDDARDDYMDIDYAKWYIENKGLPRLETARASLDQQITTRDLIKQKVVSLLEGFNTTTVDKTIFFKTLETENADTSGLVLQGGMNWEENLPFTSYCLQSDGDSGYITVPNIIGTKAISLWIKVEAFQKHSNATLLANDTLGALISQKGFHNSLKTIRINGKQPKTNTSLGWHDLPKGTWVHLYVESDQPQNDTFYLFGNKNQDFLQGKITGIRLFDKGLTEDELQNDLNMLRHKEYLLKEGKAPKYWKPTEPVLLIEGDTIEPNPRYGQDGRYTEDNTLTCLAGNVSIIPLQKTDLDTLLLETDSFTPVPSLIEASGYNVNWKPENVIDSSQGTYWMSPVNSNKEEWVQLTFDTPFMANQVQIVLNNGRQGSNPKIQGSKDGITWNTLATFIYYNYPNDDRNFRHITFSFDNTEAFTYYRYHSDPTVYVLIEYLHFSTQKKEVGFDTWTTQPWHPFILNWETGIHSLKGGKDINTGNFDATYITQHYTLPENESELSVRTGKSIEEDLTVYRGKTILTPQAQKRTIQKVQEHCNQLTIDDCYQTLSDILSVDQENEYRQRLAAWFSDKPQDDSTASSYLEWYHNKKVFKNGIVTFSSLTSAEKVNDFHYTVILAYEFMTDKHFVSQSLGGINAALLMDKQTFQLPIADPLGFDDYQVFTNTIRQAVGSQTSMSPMPLNNFMPVRSGVMRLLQIQVIDTFGQVQYVDTSHITKKAASLNPPSTSITGVQPDDIWLPPRFMQPSRLQFRWLSAIDGDQEFNAHPSHNPICGWVLANHLDNSLMIYDQYGEALGSINQNAQWQAVPGSEVIVDITQIANPYIRNLVRQLAVLPTEEITEVKKKFIQDLITVTDKALEQIDPESFVHDQELVILIGKPMAIVRAAVKLDLKGLPAVDHSWSAFYQDTHREERETRDFEKINVPVRIGEREQFNDGVVGYWKENEQKHLKDTFYTTVPSGVVANDRIKSYEEAPLAINLSMHSTTETMTLLIDPRAQVHATTGVLPVKELHIPKEQYADAIKKLNITFLSTPILIAKEQTSIPLPNEQGYQWSWLAKDRYQWNEVAQIGMLSKNTFVTKIDQGEQVWEELLKKGWITLQDSGRAQIVPVDQRLLQDLDPPFDAQQDNIQQLLDQSHITNINTQANFTGTVEAREGWLKLTPKA